MGCNGSKLDKLGSHEERELQRRFHPVEIEAFTKDYNSKRKGKTMTNYELMKHLGLERYADTEYGVRVFNVFDRDRDGKIGLSDFIHAMATITRGTQREQEEFVFRMADMNKDGFLDFHELYEFMKLGLEGAFHTAAARSRFGKIDFPVDTPIDDLIKERPEVKGELQHMVSDALRGRQALDVEAFTEYMHKIGSNKRGWTSWWTHPPATGKPLYPPPSTEIPIDPATAPAPDPTPAPAS